jgi:hypothetical protein
MPLLSLLSIPLDAYLMYKDYNDLNKQKDYVKYNIWDKMSNEDKLKAIKDADDDDTKNMLSEWISHV